VLHAHSNTVLRPFVKLVGLALMVFGTGEMILNGCKLLTHTIEHRTSFEIFQMTGDVLFWGLVNVAGWSMFRSWNYASIQAYSFLQSIFTGIAVGEVVNVFWPPWGGPIGVITLLVTHYRLRVFLIRHYDLDKLGLT
jgi:hypothetical protein